MNTRRRGGDPPQMEFDDDPRLAEIQERAVFAQEQNAALKQQLAQQAALLEDQQYNFEPIPVLPWSSKPELFLHLLRWTVIARMLLFGMVEKFGTELPYVGIGGDILFALLSLWVLFSWIKAEWHANAWLLIPRIILVVSSVVIAANCFTQGAIWDGSFLPADQPAAEETATATDAASTETPANDSSSLLATLLAAALSLFFLALAASRYCGWEMFHTQKFLDHPIRILKGAKSIYDARRKN